MNHHVMSFNYYSAFLNAAGYQPNELSASYLAYEGDNLIEDLKKTEGLGLYKDGKLTNKGKIIAKVLCQPLKTVVAHNTALGEIPLCIFNYNFGFWIFIRIEPNLKIVDLVSPISPVDIKSYAKEALIGKWEGKGFGSFFLFLTNEEVSLYNLVIMLMARRAKSSVKPLTKAESEFSAKELLSGEEMITSLINEEVCGCSELKALLNEPLRCKNLFESLVRKEVLEESEKSGYFIPGKIMLSKLMPNKNMMNLAFADSGSGISYKYYIFPDSMLEITVERGGLAFTQVSDLNYSVWEVAGASEEARESLGVKEGKKNIEKENTKSRPLKIEEKKPIVANKPTEEKDEVPVQGRKILEINFCPFCGSKIRVADGNYCIDCGKKYR